MGSAVLWVQRPDGALWLFWGCLAGCTASSVSHHITVWSASEPLTPGQNTALITAALLITTLCHGALASEVLASTDLWCRIKSRPHLWPQCCVIHMGFIGSVCLRLAQHEHPVILKGIWPTKVHWSNMAAGPMKDAHSALGPYICVDAHQRLTACRRAWHGDVLLEAGCVSVFSAVHRFSFTVQTFSGGCQANKGQDFYLRVVYLNIIPDLEVPCSNCWICYKSLSEIRNMLKKANIAVFSCKDDYLTNITTTPFFSCSVKKLYVVNIQRRHILKKRRWIQRLLIWKHNLWFLLCYKIPFAFHDKLNIQVGIWMYPPSMPDALSMMYKQCGMKCNQNIT